MSELRLLALYPEQMNIYADRGNVMLLRRRCQWRGIGFRLTAAGMGERFDPTEHDLIYIGGGQDRDQIVVAADMLATKRESPRGRARRTAPRCSPSAADTAPRSSYQLGEERLEGLGLPISRRSVNLASADWQRRDRGRPRLGAPDPGGVREPRGPDSPRSLGDAARQGAPRSRQQRTRRPRGGDARQPDRDLPPWPAAAQERLARRRADRSRARAPPGVTPRPRPLEDELEQAPMPVPERRPSAADGRGPAIHRRRADPEPPVRDQLPVPP